MGYWGPCPIQFYLGVSDTSVAAKWHLILINRLMYILDGTKIGTMKFFGRYLSKAIANNRQIWYSVSGNICH